MNEWGSAREGAKLHRVVRLRGGPRHGDKVAACRASLRLVTFDLTRHPLEVGVDPSMICKRCDS